MESKIKASIISGVLEVIFTHPIDYAKTLCQSKCNSKLLYSSLSKSPYKGIGPRLVGIVPMRVLFWNSLSYFKEKEFTPLSASLLTAGLQTSIDFPIEQIKTQRMLSNNSWKCALSKSSLNGLSVHLCRNIGFIIAVNYCISQKPNSYYSAAIGGFVGAVITHPLDSLKTWYQAGNKKYPSHWKLSSYMNGVTYRSSMSLIGMNIGWLVYNKFI